MVATFARLQFNQEFDTLLAPFNVFVPLSHALVSLSVCQNVIGHMMREMSVYVLRKSYKVLAIIIIL